MRQSIEGIQKEIDKIIEALRVIGEALGSSYALLAEKDGKRFPFLVPTSEICYCCGRRLFSFHCLRDVTLCLGKREREPCHYYPEGEECKPDGNCGGKDSKQAHSPITIKFVLCKLEQPYKLDELWWGKEVKRNDKGVAL